MSLLVDPYIISEHNRGNIKYCHECHFVAAWTVRLSSLPEGQKAFVAFACTEHVDTILYLVSTGLIGEAEETSNG